MNTEHESKEEITHQEEPTKSSRNFWQVLFARSACAVAVGVFFGVIILLGVTIAECFEPKPNVGDIWMEVSTNSFSREMDKPVSPQITLTTVLMIDRDRAFVEESQWDVNAGEVVHSRKWTQRNFVSLGADRIYP